MTRKELQKVKESYKELAQSVLASDSPYAQIVGVCGEIALEECYNHHERGQRIWAFFTALEEEGKACTKQ